MADNITNDPIAYAIFKVLKKELKVVYGMRNKIVLEESDVKRIAREAAKAVEGVRRAGDVTTGPGIEWLSPEEKK